MFSENRLFFEYFSGNLLVTLKTMKNYDLQANFQKIEKSDLCLNIKQLEMHQRVDNIVFKSVEVTHCICSKWKSMRKEFLKLVAA